MDPQNTKDVVAAASGNIDLTRVLIHGVMALFGGIVNTINCRPKSLKAIVANMIVASFSGFIAGLLAIHFFGDSEYITLTISGSGGYLGKEGLDFLSRKLFVKFLKLTLEECEVPTESNKEEL